jgi:hypothetical protein
MVSDTGPSLAVRAQVDAALARLLSERGIHAEALWVIRTHYLITSSDTPGAQVRAALPAVLGGIRHDLGYGPSTDELDAVGLIIHEIPSSRPPRYDRKS